MRENFIQESELKEIILNLSPNDCIEGPEQDRDGYKGYVLTFISKYIDGLSLYIKIRYNPPDEVCIISFHQDEYNS